MLSCRLRVRDPAINTLTGFARVLAHQPALLYFPSHDLLS